MTHEDSKAMQYLIRAREFLVEENYTYAMRYFKKAYKRRISKKMTVLLLLQMANCMDELEYYDQQQTFLEELCELELSFDNVRRLMKIYLDTNNDVKLKAFGEKIKELEINNDDEEKTLIRLLADAKNHDEVLERSKEWLEKHPGDISMVSQIINAYVGKRSYKEAYEYAEEYKNKGFEKDLILDLANVYREVFLFEEAAAYWRESMEAAEARSGILAIRARTLLNMATYAGIISFEDYEYWTGMVLESTKPPASRINVKFERISNCFKKIRVGFVSYDFRFHSVGKFIISLFDEIKNNTGIETYCYYTCPDYEDYITNGIKNRADVFKSVGRYSDKQLRKELLEDELDVVVDLNGATLGTKLALLAERFAPIQITWMGTSYSSFTYNIDYIIGDKFLDPLSGETERFLTEKTLRMDTCYMCYAFIADHEINPEPPQVKNGYVTFGMVHSPNRHSTEAIRMWQRCLDAVPNSRMIIQHSQLKDEFFYGKLVERLKKFGLDLSRVDITGFPGQDEYYETYNKCDVMLESMPLGGGTTSAEAIMMGVPVIGCPYPMRTARLSYAMMHAVGLGDLCADSLEDYPQKVAEVSQNVELLRDLRQNLRGRLRETQLFDMGLFRESFEYAIRDAYIKYCIENNGYFDASVYENNDGELLRDCVRACDILKREGTKADFDSERFRALVGEYIQIQTLLTERLFEIHKQDANIVQLLLKVSELLEVTAAINNPADVIRLAGIIRSLMVKFA